MSKKKTTKKAAAKSSSSDKLKRAVQAEIGERIKRLDDGGTTPQERDGDSPATKAAPKAKATKAAKEPKPKRVSALDAAAQVLAASETPMRAKEMIAAMEAKGLWKSPGGKTPEATLYAAIVREIKAKGDAARFRKHDRGAFLAGKAA